MAKPDFDKVIDVPVEQRVPEIEERVEYYMAVTKEYNVPDNNKLRVRVKRPQFENEWERIDWEREEIRRIKEGHEGICGKMYFWFNYVYIRNLRGGKIAPQFRAADAYWFQQVEDAMNSHEWGLVCAKRRRAGFSWKEAADVLHDTMFHPFTSVGMNSKTDRDSIILFKKVWFIYDNLPDFLRAHIGSKTATKWEFFISKKDANGNKIKTGTQSDMICVPPTDSAFEGMMLHKWICDEAGKIRNLIQMWSYTEDCLMQETVRSGTPIIFGTSGEVDKNGAGLLELWKFNEVYKLKRVFFAGWMGLAVDKYGNDQKEKCIRWILYERERRSKLSSKQYNDFLQRYPLTPEEAFSIAGGGGIGDFQRINSHIGSLSKDPVEYERGYMKWGDGENEVVFVPDKNGKIVIWERPQHLLKGYVAGCDPADHDFEEDQKMTDVSDMCYMIVKKPVGISGPKLVAEYTYRTRKANDYYEQVLMLNIWYGRPKLLIENNRYRMIGYFDDYGQKFQLARTPVGVVRMTGKQPKTIGIRMTEAVKIYMVGVIEEYIDDYCEDIPSVELCREFLKFHPDVNTDRVFGFGMCLMQLKEEKAPARSRKYVNTKTPRVGYQRVGGRIVMVNQQPQRLGHSNGLDEADIDNSTAPI